MLRTYKFRLYPTSSQRNIIDTTISLCRELYNAMLDHRIKCFKAGKSVSRIAQQNELSQIKEEFPEYLTIHSQVLQNVTYRLERAYQNFFRRVKQGDKPGFPRFKGRNRYDSFCYPQSGFKLTGNCLRLSKVGTVKVKLHRSVEGRIITCTIIRKNDKYYVCFSCEIEGKLLPKTGVAAGIDVGVSHLAITSDGQFFEKSNKLRNAEKYLIRLQREVSKKKRGSARRKKAARALAVCHEKVHNQRKDYAHKVSTELIKQYDMIAYEDLKIKNMVKNHNLAKSIIDAAWNMLFQFLIYKAESAGRQVVAVPPHQTSQKCSNPDCGKIVPKKLSERLHQCPHCGLSIHRDVNAAINILAIATKKKAG